MRTSKTALLLLVIASGIALTGTTSQGKTIWYVVTRMETIE